MANSGPNSAPLHQQHSNVVIDCSRPRRLATNTSSDAGTERNCRRLATPHQMLGLRNCRHLATPQSDAGTNRTCLARQHFSRRD